MPHTSHRKKKGTQNKRQEIGGQDGWIHVSSNTQSRTGTATAFTPETGHALGTDELRNSLNLWPKDVPMFPAKGSTLESMRERFSKVEKRWLEMEHCKKLEDVLTSKILIDDAPKISSCVVFGTGSFCGDAIHWVDRQEIAYFQLAAFRTVVSAIERVQGHHVPAHAQEPWYNDLDAALLETVNITKVDHPRGFELLDKHSCAYSPFAEEVVEEQILAKDPHIWMHREFNPFSQEEDIGNFRKTHDLVRLPPQVDLKHFPFLNSVIWWRTEQDGS